MVSISRSDKSQAFHIVDREIYRVNCVKNHGHGSQDSRGVLLLQRCYQEYRGVQPKNRFSSSWYYVLTPSFFFPNGVICLSIIATSFTSTYVKAVLRNTGNNFNFLYFMAVQNVKFCPKSQFLQFWTNLIFRTVIKSTKIPIYSFCITLISTYMNKFG